MSKKDWFDVFICIHLIIIIVCILVHDFDMKTDEREKRYRQHIVYAEMGYNYCPYCGNRVYKEE